MVADGLLSVVADGLLPVVAGGFGVLPFDEEPLADVELPFHGNNDAVLRR